MSWDRRCGRLPLLFRDGSSVLTRLASFTLKKEHVGVLKGFYQIFKMQELRDLFKEHGRYLQYLTLIGFSRYFYDKKRLKKDCMMKGPGTGSHTK